MRNCRSMGISRNNSTANNFEAFNIIFIITNKNYELDNIKTFGGKTTRYAAEGAPYPLVNFLLIFGLCTVAYMLLTKIELHPILAGLVIFSEGLIYYAFAMGMFTNDYLWFWKSIISSILPSGIHELFYDQLQVTLPGPGESYIMPIIAPISGLVLTYASNIIFQFLHEQQDKKFLRKTFGTYIAPKVLDKMYEEKQAPKLGGVELSLIHI